MLAETKKFCKQDKYVLIGIVGYFFALLMVAVNLDGTCDSGDSITHFLFSKYAFRHPENFLNHWAKPLFVLLSSPFAQFGFVGMKLFNCCIASLTVWLIYKSARILGLKHAWLAAVFLCSTPGYFIHIFSGLTEPLFALITMVGLCFALRGRFMLAGCLVSFLPFVRSEGLIIIGVFIFYLLLKKQYRFLPWLLLGHLVFSIAGAFHYHDFLWVFTKIPYSESSGKYGSGNISHFIIQLNYIIGVPLYILTGFGIIKKLVEFFSKRKSNSEISFLFEAETLLIYGVFFAFLTAHTLFWYFGIFESMGLKRVLVSVTPLAILIALKGFNFVTELFSFNKSGYYIAAAVFTIFVVVFPFVPNPAAVNWKRDLSLLPDQLLVADASQYIKTNYPDSVFMYYTHPYISVTMDRDPFNGRYNSEFKSDEIKKYPAKYIVLWDSWFSVLENGVTLEQLKNNSSLKYIKTFQTTDKGREIQLVLFESNG